MYDGVSTAGDPRLAVDGSGNVLAVFSTGTGAWGNDFQPSDGWGDAEIIDNEPNQPSNVGVALDSSGDGWASWSQAPTGLTYNIFGSRFTPGAGWAEAERVEQSNAGSALRPEVAASANGDTIFVWQQSAGLGFQVWSSGWDAAAGELRPAKRVDSGASATSPAVAMDAQGGAIAAWLEPVQVGTFDLKVVAARYSPDGRWGDSFDVASGSISGEPRVAMDAAGNAIVVYAQLAELETQVDAFARIYSGGSWEDAVVLSAEGIIGGVFQPSVAMDPNGKAVVVWREGPDIWASVFE